MAEKINWSHSSLNTIMSNPAEYYLNKIQGINPVTTKPALALGSAVHWGLEHNTADLDEYYNTEGNYKQVDNYTEEQLLAEAMVGAYLEKKEEIYKDFLTDGDETLEILDEMHELKLTTKLDSEYYPDGHNFLGIIDLLLFTKKGIILIDYKTSSRDVDWENYKSQLFKYKLLLKGTFEDIPLYKVGIINLQKTGIRQKKNETTEDYRRRLKEQYTFDDHLIQYHIYNGDEFDDETLATYTKDLGSLIDTAQTIVDRKIYYINYTNIVGTYGPSPYIDIFYNKPDSQFQFKIKDTIFDEDFGELLTERPCEEIDMLVLKKDNILNHYVDFKSAAVSMFGSADNAKLNKDKLFAELKNKYVTSEKLLNKYFNNLNKNI